MYYLYCFSKNCFSKNYYKSSKFLAHEMSKKKLRQQSSKKLRQQSSEDWDVDDEGLLLAPTDKSDARALMTSMSTVKKRKIPTNEYGFTFQCICQGANIDFIDEIIHTNETFNGVTFKLFGQGDLQIGVFEESKQMCSWTCEDLTPEASIKTLQTTNYQWDDDERLFYHLTFENPYTGGKDDGYGPSAFNYDRIIDAHVWRY